MSDSTGFRPAARPVLCLTVLVALFAVRLVDVATSHSLTADEPHYMGTGVYLWSTGDYHYARTLAFQPPLAFHLASLPLLAFDLSAAGNDRDVSRALVEGGVIDRADLRLASRLPFVAVACLGMVLVFLFAREAAGPAAGLLAALVYGLSPMLLAHGALAHSDVLIAVLYTAVVYAFWRWHREPSPARLLCCGAALGLALIAKYSALLLLPALALLLLFDLARRRTRAQLLRMAAAAAVLALASLFVIWLGYGGSFARVAEPSGPLGDVALPGWLQPFFFFQEVNVAGRRVFFLGEFARTWPGYLVFPVAYAIKTPLGILALLALGLASLRRTASPLGRFLGVPVAVFLAVVFFWVRVPVGLRYLLPLYPLIAVFVGTQLAALRPGWTRRIAVLAALQAAVAGLLVHPHYLSYFNLLVGGPDRGHRYLLDSNLDWGQDLPALADALRARGNPEVALAYFGPEDPAHYGIRATPLEGCTPVEGWVAISANVREGLYAHPNLFAEPTPGCYDWLDAHDPVARPGHSIFLYDVEPRRSGRPDGPAPPADEAVRSPATRTQAARSARAPRNPSSPPRRRPVTGRRAQEPHGRTPG